MKLPSYLDFAFLLAALPPRQPKEGEIVVLEQEDSRLSLLTSSPAGLPYRPLGYLLLLGLGL